MIYVTVPQNPRYHQITFEEILSGTAAVQIENEMVGSTRTVKVESLPPISQTTAEALQAKLINFRSRYQDLLDVSDRHSLYNSFVIPKNSGGLRHIDAPLPPLMNCLRELKELFETDFGALHHTSAFAYVKNRCAVDAVKRHQANNSNWFLKLDFSNFFGNTTRDYVLKAMSEIYPFCYFTKGRPYYTPDLENVLDLCFLDGGLPQGTPISPLLTNLIMIPIDFELYNTLRHYNKQTYVYTRYADDMLISSYLQFNHVEIQNLIKSVLKEHGAPYTLKREKTRYASKNGSNWNLGVMLNKDNEITIGHARKKSFRAMVSNFILDTIHGKPWDVGDVQSLNGLVSYYSMIEPEYIKHVIDTNNKKYSVNFQALVKSCLS